MKSKKIAYLIFRTRENTGSKVVFQQVAALSQRGHSVSVYSIFGKPASWFPKDIVTKSVLHLLFQRPDILVATFWPTAYVAALFPAKKKYYLVMGWEEDFYTNPTIRFFARNSYKLPLKKIVLSDYLKERLHSLTKKKDRVDKIVTYLIDPRFFRKKATIRKVGKQRTILSVISWYNRYKGPDLLVKAIKELKAIHPEYCFVLVGREKHPYSDDIDTYYANPTTTKLVKLFGSADCLLITSRVEGFYIPGLEAMANCLPVITTNSGGVLEYAIHEKTAIVLNKLEELWKDNTIEELLTNTGKRKRLIANAYKLAVRYRNYTTYDMGEDLEKIYSR